jgi:D-glycero-D-manno-heptose 1,7-bisphosphate phosphatase
VGSFSGMTPALRAVLFDRDGTLVADVPYNGEPDAVVAKQGAYEAVHAARRRGLRTGVVTNQSGIGRGFITFEQVEQVNRRIDSLFGAFDTWEMCPHSPTDACTCRKPAPGLLIRAAASLGVSPRDLLLVGDRLADLGAARSAGAISVLVPSVATEAGAESAADHVIACLNHLPRLIDTLMDV